MADVKINDLTLAGAVSDSMQLETDISGLTANKVTALQIKTYAQAGIDHGSLNGLADDDHTLYSLADGTRWTTTQTPLRAVEVDASGNLVSSSITATELGYLNNVTSNIQVQLDSKYDSDGDIDHGGINGLADDDHTQYSLANGTRWTTTNTPNRVPISDGSGNLVVSSTTDTELSYLNNVTSDIQTQLNTKYDTDTDVDHDATTNFVANEHINHTSVTLTAGEGLTGGGDISANRTFDLDVNGLSTEVSSASGDYFVFYDTSAGTHKKIDHDDMPGGGGGSSTFTGLTDTPANYTGAGSQLVAVNSGATALEFVDAPSGVTTGATLPASPSTGDMHVHTPTGRTWLMQYDGSNWKALRAYGTSAIYVNTTAAGSQDWDEGYSTGTEWELEWATENLPAEYDGTITVNLANATYNGETLNITARPLGTAKLIFLGNTTTQVASTTFSSGSNPYQSWTMSATVSAGSEGDIVEYVSGTDPGTNPSVGGDDANCWCLLSRSGTNLQIAGGIAALQAPDNTSVFRILSRNSTFEFTSAGQINISVPNVYFKYINFFLDNTCPDHIFFTDVLTTYWVGCEFAYDTTTTRAWKGFENDVVISCYGINAYNSQRNVFWLTNGAPKVFHRTLLKTTSTNSPSAANVLRVHGTSVNTSIEVSGCRFWHTQSGARLGEFRRGCKLRFLTDFGDANTDDTWFVVGGGSADCFAVSDLSWVGFVGTNVTVSGTSGNALNVDASTYGIGS